MSGITVVLRRRRVGGVARRAVVLAVLVLAALSANASAAPPPPGHYSISATGGATFQLFTAGNLVSGIADDQIYYLSTTGSGLSKLPFTIRAYNRGYQKMGVSTNGNVQLGVSPTVPGTTVFSNDCLPSTSFPKTTIMPFWDDLFFDSNDTSHGFMEGVFVKTKGSAPHRTFIVSWQGHRFNDAGTLVQAQVIFKEGLQTITYVYGLNGGGSATVGTRFAGQGSFTQWTCNSGSGTSVTSGMRLTFLHAG